MADDDLGPPSKAELRDPSVSQTTHRFRGPIIAKILLLTLVKVNFCKKISVPRLVQNNASSQNRQVLSKVPVGQLQKRILVRFQDPERPVITADILVQLVASLFALPLDFPMTAELLIRGDSLVKLAWQNQKPLLQFQATVKLLKTTFPTCQAKTPSYMFLQIVKLWYTA